MRRILGGMVALGILSAAAFTGTAQAAQDDQEKIAASNSVVVNEVTTRGPNGQLDEAIEIRNVSNQYLNLSGYTVRVYSQFNTLIDTITVPAGTMLSPRGNQGEFLVLTGQNFSGTIQDQLNVVPFTAVGAEGLPSTGGVAIFSPSAIKIDGVAFSNSALTPREGVATAAENNLTAQLGSANARDVLSTDRDNNQLDFSLHQRTLGAVN